MPIDRDIVEAIRERVDLVQVVSGVVSLQRKGNSFVGLCPFHEDRRPSFSVVPHKGIYHCFACGEGGDVFKFLMRTRGLSFPECVRELGESCGIAVEERELSPEQRKRARTRRNQVQICKLAAGWFQRNLLAGPQGESARAYLKGRGLGRETIERFRLGFAPPGWSGLIDYLHSEGVSVEQAVEAGLARWRNNRNGAYDLFRERLMVPIEDNRGRVVAFGGRVLPGTEADNGDAPKYVNSPESAVYQKSKLLYGLPHAMGAIQRRGRLIVVEGYFDVLALHQAGFQEAVATCGTALTGEHARLIRPLTRTVVALFDADEAGSRAAVRSLSLFLDEGISAQRVDLGHSKDPDEFIQTNGAPAFEEALGRAEPLFELALRRAADQYGNSPGARDQILDALAPLVRKHGAGARAAVETRLARHLGLNERVIREQIGRGGGGRRGETESSMRTQAPRWRGSRDLNHLFWLLLHYPAEVASVLRVADPELVTDRPGAQRAIALLLSNVQLPEVVDQMQDADVAQVLFAAAARTELYPQEKAASAMEDILNGLRVQGIESQLSALDKELSTCAPSGDRSRYLELLQNRQRLQREKDALKRGSSPSQI